MNLRKLLGQLGKPDICVADLKIWIHGRAFPHSNDAWDGNWLRATVRCAAEGAEVYASGSIVNLRDLGPWLDGCRRLHKQREGTAELNCTEPYLSVVMTVKDHGHACLAIQITPDPIMQEHKFTFDLDQSCLPGLIAECEQILRDYPIRG